MNNTNLDFRLLHDSGKILCFVGHSYGNFTLFNYFQPTRPCEIYRIEEIENNSSDWFDARQFISVSADIALKRRIVDSLQKHNPDYFSVVAARCHIGFNVEIGRGTYISDFNTLLDNTVVGNYVVITHYVSLSHEVKIGDYCHIGPSAYLLFTNLGAGSYVAAKSNFLGKTKSPITTADHCNYLIGSTVTKNITATGTYHNNRHLNSNSSLNTKID